MIFTLVLACTTPESTPDTVLLSNSRLLRRMSLDIRGTLPSYEEYEQVQQNDVNWESIAYELMDDPNFEMQLVHRFGGLWHTRVDEFDIVADDYDLNPVDWWFPFTRSVGEEPLRWMAYVASHELSWTQIVTSDTTMANSVLASIFPIEFIDGTSNPDTTELDYRNIDDWKLARYTDGRPPVGVLSTNGLWWRYPTDSFNMNRTRASMMTRLLLCDDYLARPIDFSAGTDILENTEDAIQNDPSCLTCHASLDPLAASMFGFWWVERYNPLEATYYHPERELMGEQMMNVQPSWFGQPVVGFADVGQHIANDTRFHQCTVRQAGEMLLNRPMSATDFSLIQEITANFTTEFQYKKVWADWLTSDEYRLATASIDHPDTRPDRQLTPFQISTSLSKLTGFSWIQEDLDLMDVDFRTMAGGIDGYQTFERQHFPNLSSTLVLQRLVQASVSFALTYPDESPLFSEVPLNSTPDSDAGRAFLTKFRLITHGKSTDPLWIEDTTLLWYQILEASRGDFPTAWEVTLTAILQDADFVRY